MYAPNGNIRDVLVTSDVTIDGTGVVTNSGEELNSVELGNYAAVSNGGSGGAEANTEFHYIIETENGWENVGVGSGKFNTYFKTVNSENGLKYDNEKGVYTYKGEVVSSDNIYYIKDGDTVNAGVFVVNGEVYKSTVYGNTKEILTTVKDKNGSLKTFWSTEAESSDIYLKDSNIKVSDLNTAFDTIEANEKRLENNDIREITVTPNENKIGLVRNSDKEVDGSIYVSSVVGKNGNAQVKFAQKGEDGQETSSFVVDAGSIVKANPEGATSGTKLSTVAINGINYQLATGISGGEVGDDGTVYITQEGSTEKTPIGKIEVVGTDVNVTSEQTTNNDGVKGIKYTVSNNLTVAEDKDTDENKGNWTITDASKPEGQQKFTNTTLDKAGSTVADGTTANGKVYGKTYTVKDTSGNTIQLIDVASGNVLQNVDSKVGDTNYSSTNYIHNEDNLTTAASILDSNIKATADKVDAGWTATAGGNSIAVNPTETGTTTLNFAGDKNINVTADKASSTINVKLDPTLEVESVTATGSVNVGRTTISSTGLTAGDVKVNAESATVTGLSNTTWNKDYKITTGQAATEDQLQAAVQDINTNSYKGWNVTTNKGTKTAEVASDGNVDFSNNDKNIIVGQDGTNLTFDLNDNITLGDESGTRIQLNGNPQEDSMISITNKDSDTVFNIAKDGTVHSDGDIVAKADSNKKYSLSEVGENAVRYNADKSTVALAGTNGTTITNVADGDVSEGSKEAVNGSQLYATNQKVDAGWVATDGANKVNVNPDNNTLKFTGDDKNNITVTAATDEDTKENSIKVELSDNLNVANVNASGDVTTPSADGTKNYSLKNIGKNTEAIYGTKVNGEYVTTVTGTLAATTIQNTSAKFRVDESGNVAAGKVIINATGDISGLSNTTWNGTTNNPSRAATEGQLQQVSTDVDAGWIATDGKNNVNVNPDNNILKFTGDDKNITVTATTDEDTKENSIKVELSKDLDVDNVKASGDVYTTNIAGEKEYSLKDIGYNTQAIKYAKDHTAVDGLLSADRIQNENRSFMVEENGNITAGGVKVYATTGEVTGLTNTTWDGSTNNITRAATEGQLQMVSDKVTAGWTATDDAGHKINVNPNTRPTLNFASGKNITVSANEDNGEVEVSLNDVVTLGDGEDAIKIDGTNGTLNIGSTFAVAEDGTVLSDGDVIADADGEKYSLSEVGKYAVRYDKTNDGTSTITLADGDDLSGTRIKNVADGVDPKDAVNVSQLEAVEATANAGWTASDGTNSISVKPNETLTFVGDENLTVSADGTDKKLKVSLNDNITLGDGQSAITLNGSPQNSDDPALSVGTDKFVVAQDGSLSVSDKFNVDAETGNIYAANNSGSAIMMNDDSVALNAGGNGIVASDEGILLNTNGIDEDIKLVTKGTSVSVDNDGATFTNTNTNETTNIDGGTINVGDRLMVEEDGSIYATNNNGSTVMINDNGVALNSEGNGVVVSGEGITLNTNGSAVTVDRFNGATFTNTNTGETTNINGDIITTDTVKGLSNTTWDDELATQVANSEELQGTAATQGQLQQAVSAVATEAAKQHTTVSGDDNLTVKSSVNENGGTNYQVTLDDDITLGNPEAGNTKGERSFTINTTDPEGYVPESYETGSGADFIKENGGFMLFATDTQGYGVFGVTAKGSAWAKDFKTYTTDIYGNNTQYSLNDVGDAVAQMSSYYNKENGKSYTVFSRYLNEAEKDNPFATVDENATRDIPLALRDDGAMLIGATIKGDDFTDNGIRINAETETTYDGDGNEVTNNIATITGLENTEWKPPTPVATFAANDINTTSRAATESQLNDLYSSVVGYNVEKGKVNTSHVTLGGTKDYKSYESRDVNGTKTYSGGVTLDNVAYATGEDGSEAVNVDYLNNAIKDAVKDGPVASNEKHLDTSKTYTPDKTTGTITINEVDGTGAVTGNQLVINDVASKAELDSLKTGVGDRNYNNVTDTTPIANGDSVTTAIGKLNNSIKGVTQDVINNSISGGHVDETGKVVLEKGEGENKSEVTTDIQLTDSEVSGVTLEKDTETGKNVLTITSTDKYDKNKTSSVTVSGLEIASTDDIKDVTGVASSEDLKDAYKDADKDGNATTEYITDSESMVEADVALDHAIQDVANTSYANDMVLSNRIDSVEKRLGNVEERIDKVGAMAAAIANLRTMGFDPEAPTEIAIGVGQYKSETGIAIGVFHYPNQDFMLSASLSSSGDELMGGIGATWKLGRKSAAERAKDEEARHLEQAEEMKKLAQQEKVKAQAQRHAKLLAERQQASQKNA